MSSILDSFPCVSYGVSIPLAWCFERDQTVSKKGVRQLVGEFLKEEVVARVIGIFASLFFVAESVTQFGLGCYRGGQAFKAYLLKEEYNEGVAMVFGDALKYFGIGVVASLVGLFYPRLINEFSDEV